jgi:ribonuclease HI/probable phosphoglycerate mutase
MEKVTIYTHGLSKGNPGPATVGVRILSSTGKVLHEGSEIIGNATDDYATYYAVVRGLQITVDLFGEKTKEMKFDLVVDNEVLQQQLNAKHQIKDVSLIGYFIEIYNLRVANFPNLDPVYIEAESNK